MRDMEQAIRERAYYLWVADGRRDGCAEMHWLSAQRELLAASLEGFARVTISRGVSAHQNMRRKPQAKRSAQAA
jgi:hypothetical protein